MEISIRNLATKIAALTGFPARIVWDTSHPRRCLDVSRAEREFGFRAHPPSDLGLLKIVEWYRAHRLAVASTPQP